MLGSVKPTFRLMEPDPVDANAPLPPATAELVGQIVEFVRREGVQPGERLFEYRLSKKLGLSRGPVRAALRALTAYGLTDAVPNKGFVLREPLDSPAARQALMASDVSEGKYLAIAKDRLDGRLPDLVKEAELMRRYGLKRAELLRLLDRMAAEGWVERTRGYGWQFAPTINSPDAYAQTGRLRMIIEPAGILEPTFRWDPDRMAVVREHQERVLKDGLRVFTLSEMFRFGCEIHEAIAECSGNLFLVDTLKRLNRIRRLFAYRFIPDLGHVERHTREHIAMLDLLGAGEREKAAHLMREHLLWSAGASEVGAGPP
jgi:DNA-binding GntR family transcriptional regulator